ncbi:hypothetical protein [Chryseobacterium lactis]|nr:hypothetical protein [Chryseobacterium lactis]
MDRLKNDGEGDAPETQNQNSAPDHDQMKADNQQKMEEKRAENEEKDKKEEGLLLAIDGAKIKFNDHTGTFKVLSNVPTTQDKLTGTIVEKQIPNFIFDDGFLMITLTEWQDFGTAKVQENYVLLKKSTLPGTGKMPGSVPPETGKIEFVTSGQVNAPESIDAKGAPVPEQKKETCGIQYRNDITCVKYGSKNPVYGPLYSGSIKLASYKKWDTIVLSGKVTTDEKEIILAMSENEGNMDAIQSYDSEIITAGAMQKTINPEGYGELSIQLWEFKQEYPDKFKELFENCGWNVKEIEIPQKNKKVLKKYQAYYNDKTGKDLKALIRKGFEAKKNKQKVICIPMESFINACKDPDFQSRQIVDFIKRLNSAINKKPTGFSNPIKDFVKSKLGKATVLDHDVNRPGHVSDCFRDALNQFFASNKKVSKNPVDWTGNHSIYEKEILEIYGPLRGKGNYTMTDASGRYTKLKTKL